MTTTPAIPPAAATDPGAQVAAASARTATCCRRPMSSIEVTARGATLVLHSCTACGRHEWERDGRTAGREELIAGVRTFLEQPRLPVQRRRRSA